ncbi:MAG: hypothetical protein NTZ85_05065 [Bacteroidia bacterium]|jgi:hypothetical protein|nr:hypothetical protein [Bacteroidia bacterium]
MKKILMSLSVVLFTASQLMAQDPSFQKGDNVINLGIGLGSTMYFGTGYRMAVPPVSASYEFCIIDGIAKKGAVGIAPYIGFSSYKYKYEDWGWRYTNIILGVRGAFHYPFVDKLDTYAGIMLGYDIITWKEIGDAGDNTADAPGSFVHSEFIGARYYFANNFAAFAELGYGISWFTVGMSFKF